MSQCQTNQPTSTYGNYPGMESNPYLGILHSSCMDDNIGTKQTLTFSPSVDRKWPLWQPKMSWMKTVQNNLNSRSLSLTEAVDLTKNWPLWTVDD